MKISVIGTGYVGLSHRNLLGRDWQRGNLCRYRRSKSRKNEEADWFLFTNLI